ncbi:MAG: ThiF family adenylyltransferase, partial [Candidatus Dadabacteria bacterium]|nr:ThiF family adenylyltransferase [Candidatus Dadabacteria bacterium]
MKMNKSPQVGFAPLIVLGILAFLGVGSITLIEVEDLDESNMNRLIVAQHTDPISGTKKIAIAKRLINSVDDKIKVHSFEGGLYTEKAFERLKQASQIFGCVD